MNNIPVPFLPETAPFTPEQRGYLNGLLAGFFSRTALHPLAAPVPLAAARAPQKLTILFGSQTGTAESLAKRAALEAQRRGFAPTVRDLALSSVEQLPHEPHLLLLTSTFGDGEPPDNARAFFDRLHSPAAPPLPDVRFSVLSLGDSSYPKFCECGRSFDRRFEELGATRAYPRTDCDLDCDEPFAAWLEGALAALQAHATPPQAALPQAPAQPAPPAAYDRKHPFPATVLANRKLTGPGSAKEVRHLEFSLEGSGLEYEAGDALGVCPANCPELVREILQALHCSGEEDVPRPDQSRVSLSEALSRHYEITRINPKFLQALAEKTDDAQLRALARPGANGELARFLWGRETIDLLLQYRNARFSPAEFVGLLRKLPPRLYSISSSPRATPGQVHLTVGVVRYETFNRSRQGVCSTFLADRLPDGATAPVFVHRNKNFRLPADPATPVIMIGPGTGIAPFRAFLQERRALRGPGRNWLFFGDQHQATEFLYREELETFQRDGTLKRLEVAFSRDQPKKIYVQHRLLEHARALFAWIEEGAHLYICGDAKKMARDVHQTLLAIIQEHSGLSPEAAAEYMQRLKADKRYQTDVY